MNREWVRLESDLYKALDSEGNVKNPTYNQLNFGDYGTNVKIYIGTSMDILDGNVTVFRAVCAYNASKVRGNPNDSMWNAYLTVKSRVEISTNNFQTIAQTFEVVSTPSSSGEDTYWVPNIGYANLVYSRKLPYGYGLEKTASMQFDRALLNSASATLQISNTVFQYRVRTFYRNASSAWVDGGLSRTYSAYAPYILNVTKPEHFYINGLNTFGVTIDASVTSNITWGLGSDANIALQTGNYNRPVRTVQAPYPDTGVSTTSVYWYPGCYASTVGSDPTVYAMDVTLETIDPENSKYRAIVASRKVTGNIETLAETDLTPFTWTMSCYDPEGNYETYGYLLRNSKSTFVWRLVYEARYGAYIRADIAKFQSPTSSFSTTYVDALSPQTGSGTFEITQAIPKTGTVTYTAFRIYSLNYNGLRWEELETQSVTEQILDYFIPSFPNLAIHRCNEDGSANDNGAFCKIEWSVNIFPIANQNGKALTIDQPSGTTVYDPLDSYTQYGTLIVAASTERAFTIKFTLSDDLNTTVRTMRLSTAGVIMDWLNKGKGVSFGKVANTRDAVEISSDWKLICYYLMLNGTDMLKWMNDVKVRLDGLESYTSNIRNTGQYRVTFYNDSSLWDRQWIKSGENANLPNGVPTRESTRQYAYSFAGWALTKGATVQDPNALLNITSYRNIYAAYQQTLRVYKVEFYNGDTLVDTQNEIQYGTEATTSVTPTGDGTFFGFFPKPSFVDQNMLCYAKFYTHTEITDDWDTIIEKCKNKTAGNEYKLGQYKPLTLTSGSTVNMRLVGIREDVVSGLDKAELTWISESVVGSAHAMNTTRTPVPIRHDVNSKIWFEREDTTGYRDYYVFQNIAGSIRLKISIPILQTGTLRYRYVFWGNGSTTNIYINGTLVQSSSSSGSGTEYTSVVKENENVEFEYEIILGDVQNASSIYGNRVLSLGSNINSSPYTGIVDPDNATFSGDVAPRRSIQQYETGKGMVGGWEHMELRAYLQSDILPLIPENVRENLRYVEKSTYSLLSTVEDEYSTNDATLYRAQAVTTDNIWVPSKKEMFGTHAENQEGLAEYGKAGSNYPASSVSWLRDVSQSDDENGTTYYSSNSSPGVWYANQTRNISIGFCT